MNSKEDTTKKDKTRDLTVGFQIFKVENYLKMVMIGSFLSGKWILGENYKKKNYQNIDQNKNWPSKKTRKKCQKQNWNN